MSLVIDHMKAKKILDKVLKNEIKSDEEVVEKMGSSEFYKLWSKNIWELHSTEAPSNDLKTRLPSSVPQKKEWKIICNKKEEVFIVNSYSFTEAICAVKNYLKDDNLKGYIFSESTDCFKRDIIRLS